MYLRPGDVVEEGALPLPLAGRLLAHLDHRLAVLEVAPVVVEGEVRGGVDDDLVLLLLRQLLGGDDVQPALRFLQDLLGVHTRPRSIRCTRDGCGDGVGTANDLRRAAGWKSLRERMFEHVEPLVELGVGDRPAASACGCTLPYVPAERSSRPRVAGARTTRGGALLVRALPALRSFTSSSARMAPRPRASPMNGKRRARPRSARAPPRRSPAARSQSRSARSISMAASAAAQATGLPPKVPPSPPGCAASISSARPITAESGRPPASDFARRHEVGLEAVVLAGEQPAGAAEAGLHLVGDEQDAVLAADRAPARAGSRRWRDDEAALARAPARSPRRRPASAPTWRLKNSSKRRRRSATAQRRRARPAAPR